VWYHIVVTQDGIAPKTYINGDEVSTELESGSTSYNSYYLDDLGTGNNYIIGRNSFTQAYYFDGLIDEVRIYNRALSADEIKAQYETPGASVPSSTVTPTPSSTISYPSTVETPTATPSAEAQARNSRLMLYGLIGAIGVVGVVIAVKVGGNVTRKARERKEEKMHEQREREEYERKLKEWEDQGYDVSGMKEELKK
jgi:hypothetical protein